ncbi:hypothetical protein K8T06_13745 [bacterium]|nr:hypothetical protein [bacterium]
MQGYLFPMKRQGFPDPYRELLERIIPGAQHSVLLVDPSPQDELLEAIARHTGTAVTKRILIRRDILNLGDSFAPDALKPKTRRMIHDNCIEVRAISRLSARITIVDDKAMIISGDPGGNLCWGVELNVVDAQPVIDFWENRFHEASKISDAQAGNIWDIYQERFWTRAVNPLDVIALYNGRGAFIDDQVRIFSGYRQLTLHPFSSSEGLKGPAIRWRLVNSRHYQAIGKQAAKIHGLKSLGIIRETPAGAYLPHSEIATWQHLFAEREMEFKHFVTDYLNKNYSIIRNEALQDLLNRFLAAFREMKSGQQLLPMLNDDFVEDQAREIHHRQYPDEQSLTFACQARYISFGLHPDAATDRVLMDSLSASAVSDVLL